MSDNKKNSRQDQIDHDFEDFPEMSDSGLDSLFSQEDPPSSSGTDSSRDDGELGLTLSDLQSDQSESVGDESELDVDLFAAEAAKGIDELFAPENKVVLTEEETRHPGADFEPESLREGSEAEGAGAAQQDPVIGEEAPEAHVPFSPSSAHMQDQSEDELDIDQFTDQVSKGIDELFIPEKRPGIEEEAAEASGQDPGSPSFQESAETAPVDQGSPEIDFDMFGEELDKGVDQMFASQLPASLESAAEESFEGSPADEPLMFEESSPEEAEPSESTVASEEFEDEETTMTILNPAFKESEDMPEEAQPRGSEMVMEAPVEEESEKSELQELIESLRVSYLSLEWEFSSDNIEETQQNLTALEPHSKGSKEATLLYGMLREVLRTLKADQSMTAATVLNFIGKGVDLMEVLFPEGGVPDAKTKQTLNALMRQFKTIKSQAPKTAAPAKPEPVQSPPPPEAQPRPEASPPEAHEVEEPPVPAQEPKEATAAAEPSSELKDLVKQMETLAQRYSERLKGLEQEKGRLSKLESVLSKNPGLAPVLTVVQKLSTNLDKHLDAMKRINQDWSTSLQELRAFSPAHPVQESASEASASAGPAEEPLPEKPEPAPAEQTEVYRFTIQGRPLAIPAHAVVKTTAVAPKKIKKVLKRGHAALADFKSLFGGLKTGLLGEWKALDAKELKAWQFAPVRTEVLSSIPDLDPMNSRAAFLISDGGHHGIIFVDSLQKNQAPQTVALTKTSRKRHVLGYFRDESGNRVEVLDLKPLVSDSAH